MLNLTEPYLGGCPDAPADLEGGGVTVVRAPAGAPAAWLPWATRRWRISRHVAERLRTMSRIQALVQRGVYVCDLARQLGVHFPLRPIRTIEKADAFQRF